MALKAIDNMVYFSIESITSLLIFAFFAPMSIFSPRIGQARALMQRDFRYSLDKNREEREGKK